MSRLSLSMIVKDEERFLPGCLDSVRGIADEIIVVDTGSSDRTIEIAKAAGAQVFSCPWTGDFSAARNASLAQCTGDWVLYLDADERLAPDQGPMVDALLANPAALAYNVTVRNTISLEDGKKTVQLMPYPRLFRRLPSIQFERAVHEQIAPSIFRAGGKIQASGLLIEHLGYAQGFDVLKEKSRRNLKPLLEAVRVNPDDWYAHFQLARTFLLTHDFPAVLHHARIALRKIGLPRVYAASLHNILAEAALKTGNKDAAIEHCRKSLAIVNDQVGATWFLAGALASQGALRAAIPLLEVMILSLKKPRGTAMEIDDIIVPPDAIHDLLGRCFVGIGNLERAALEFRSALLSNPKQGEVLDRFVGVHEKLDMPALAVEQCASLKGSLSTNVRFLTFFAFYQKRAGFTLDGLGTLEEMLVLDPSNTSALSWKALWSMELGLFEQAEQTLQEAKELGVSSDELRKASMDLAIHFKRYQEALLLLDGLSHVIPEEQFHGLKEKLGILAAIKRM